MQLQAWSGTNWSLIVGLVLGSAVLAVLGDILGFRYGKQRISVFGLRPKYTSRLITAVTGGIISIVILTVLSVLSQHVRTALFSMQYVQQQLMDLRLQLQTSQTNADKAVEDLTFARNSLEEQQELLQATAISLDLARLDLESLRNDRILLENEKRGLETAVAAMREESEELKRELNSMRSEAIALHANVLLAQCVVPPGSTEAQVSGALQALEKDTRIAVLSRLSERRFPQLRELPVVFDAAEAEEAVARLTQSPERCYVRALSAENVAQGEPIKVRLEVGESLLVYASGEPIHRKLLHTQESDLEAEEALHLFLRELKRKAIHDGVIPDPATNSVGTLGGGAFFDVVDALRNVRSPVIVTALASSDIYTEGPVDIEIILEE